MHMSHKQTQIARDRSYPLADNVLIKINENRYNSMTVITTIPSSKHEVINRMTVFIIVSRSLL